jgi:hypothetical protein
LTINFFAWPASGPIALRVPKNHGGYRPGIEGLRAGLFLQTLLTLAFTFVIIVGFAIKSEDFCPAEALQVVCSVDDGPKTDWQVVRFKRGAIAGASWEPI